MTERQLNRIFADAYIEAEDRKSEDNAMRFFYYSIVLDFLELLDVGSDLQSLFVSKVNKAIEEIAERYK